MKKKIILTLLVISIVAIAIAIAAIVIVAIAPTTASSGMSKHNIMKINHGFQKNLPPDTSLAAFRVRGQ